jgi:hypothetical protein
MRDLMSHCSHPCFPVILPSLLSCLLRPASHERAWDGGVGSSRGYLPRYGACLSWLSLLVLISLHCLLLSARRCIEWSPERFLRAWWYVELAESDMLIAAGGGLVFRVTCLEQVRMVGLLGMFCRQVTGLESCLDRGGCS